MADYIHRRVKLGIELLYLIFISGLNTAPVSSLITIPVNDELLGPGQCPTGSFCIVTTYCTKEYYVTKSGLPFYCGPNHHIDSMICCISTAASMAEIPPSHLNEENSVKADAGTEPFEFNDLEELIRTNRSSADDDEVNMLALKASQIDENPYDDIALPNSNAELEGYFNTPRDLEAMIEDAIEQELASEQPPTIEEEIGGLEPNEAVVIDSPREPEPGVLEIIEVENKEHVEDANANVMARARTLENVHQEKPACQCEKGPKGDPGEPGKIIYIPVFIATNDQVPPSGIPLGAIPQPFNPSTLNSQFGLNQGQQVHQVHPNPTIIPYKVPITLPLSNNAPPNVPPVTPLPHPQQPQYPQTPGQHPHPIPLPFPDVYDSRITRRAREQRYEQSRMNFHGRHN